VIVVGDKPEVEIHNLKESKKLGSFTAHKTRVKDAAWVEERNLLVTGSNCDSMIKMWKFGEDDEVSKSKGMFL
jgi:WD40 repeat protein